MNGIIGAARGLSSSTGALAETLRQSVVEVRDGASGAAAGIVWGGAGLVVTNLHCVRRGAAITVRASGVSHDARLVAQDQRHDLALLAAPALRGPLLELRDPATLRAGELVFAHGHPLGVRDALAMGVLHLVVHDHDGVAPRWIVSDIRLAPGNSGGPLIDAEGRLLGINSMVVGGLGLAVPAALAGRLIERALSRRAA